jgi:hypothetical protein
MKRQYTEINDWRELYFFRSRGGISDSDLLQAAICYDYELVRSSSAITDYIVESPGRVEHAMAYLQRLPYLARWAPNLQPERMPKDPEVWPSPEVIPTCAVLAPWFPAPWLHGRLEDRRKICHVLTKAYSDVRPLHLRPWPVDPEIIRLLQQQEDYSLWVVALDDKEPLETSARRFIRARQELSQKPRKRSKFHRTDRGPIAALNRLTCYRLSLLSPQQRREWAEKLPDFSGVRNVDTKVAQGKRLVLEDFRKRNYLKVL